jgi:hypothetical protein
MDTMTQRQLLNMFIPTLGALFFAAVLWLARAQIFTFDSPDNHWSNIFYSTENYQAIAAGDSRIATGINPQEFKNARMLNFGFTNACYNQDYLAAIENLLEKKGAVRYVLLGVGPYNLSRKGCKLSGFEKLKPQGQPLSSIEKLKNDFSYVIRPFRSSHFDSIRDQAPKNYINYHADGWLAATNMEPGYEAMNFLALLKDNEIDSELTANFVQWVQKLSQSGISVFFFYPPTGSAQVQAEIRLKNFMSAHVTERLESAGAIQIRMPAQFLREAQYDGVHLTAENATVLSQFLAEKINSFFAARENVH